MKKVVRYNREVYKLIHRSDDLIMLWQKNTEKLKSRWRDSFRISDYDESHEISFILTQFSDRKIRDTFHDDHLRTFTSRTEYFMNNIDIQDLSQHQTIRRTRVRKEWNIVLFLCVLIAWLLLSLCEYTMHSAVNSFFLIESRELLLSVSFSRWAVFSCLYQRWCHERWLNDRMLKDSRTSLDSLKDFRSSRIIIILFHPLVPVFPWWSHRCLVSWSSPVSGDSDGRYGTGRLIFAHRRSLF